MAKGKTPWSRLFSWLSLLNSNWTQKSSGIIFCPLTTNGEATTAHWVLARCQEALWSWDLSPFVTGRWHGVTWTVLALFLPVLTVLNPGTRWVLVKPSVYELWVSPPPPLLRHSGLLMSMPYFYLPFISVHSHRAGNNLGSCVFQAKDILCTKLWSVKIQSLFREQWNSGYKEQNMQVLKLSFFPLLCLERRRESVIRRQQTNQSAKAEGD